MDERVAKIEALNREIDLLKMEEHRILRLTSMEKEDSAFIGEMNYRLAIWQSKAPPVELLSLAPSVHSDLND